MAEISTLARPYAQAAFELAKAKNALPDWSNMLNHIAAVVADTQMQALVGNPNLSKDQLVTLVIDVAGGALNEQGKNFVKLLVENGRLKVAPEIANLFDAMRAEEEATIAAEVVSAVELSADQKSKIAAALKKRLGREVTLETRIDGALLGGAWVRAGDLVIDGTVSGQLNKLASALQG